MPKTLTVERVQIGLRLEKGMAGAVQALARTSGTPLGHLLEDVVNHALSGASTFSGIRDPRMPARRKAEFRSLLRKAGYSTGAHDPMTFVEKDGDAPPRPELGRRRIRRIALGVRMEKRMVKVLKALAACFDLTLEQMMEDILAHAFEGVSTFPGPGSPSPVARRIRLLAEVYGLDYGVHDHLAFVEGKGKRA